MIAVDGRAVVTASGQLAYPPAAIGGLGQAAVGDGRCGWCAAGPWPDAAGGV